MDIKFMGMVTFFATLLCIPNKNTMNNFENKAAMEAGLNKKGFIVVNKAIFKGTEYAGNWDYTSPPKSGKEEMMSVKVSFVLKFRED